MHRWENCKASSTQTLAVPPGWNAEDANPVNRREVWYQPAQTQPHFEPRPRKHRSRNSAGQQRHKAEKAKKAVEQSKGPEQRLQQASQGVPAQHLNTSQAIPSSSQGGKTGRRPTRRGKRAGASKRGPKQSAESEANSLGLEEESDPSHPSTPSQASEELPIHLPSAEGDVNSGEATVNEQHVARSVTPIDSSRKSTSHFKPTSAISSEPNPTASLTEDTSIPTEGKASLEETVVLTECQNFVGKLILLDAFEKNQVPAQLEELKDFMLLSSWREPLPVVVQDLDLPAESDAAIKMEYSTVNYWRQAPRLVDDAELEADSKEIVPEVQNCATEDQPHGTGSPNTLHLSTPGLNIASHNTNAAMKTVQVNNNFQSPAPKKVSLKQAFKSGGYLAATYFCAGAVAGVAEGMARGVGLLL